MSGVTQNSPGFLSYWFDKLHPEDLSKFQAQAGDPQFNVLWEALAVLVSVRVWRTLFTRSAPVSVSSDNLGALAVLQQHSTPSVALNTIAQEFALGDALLSLIHI
eukprot:6720765-Alexandrium_andersonii.AAC.1